jgi:hypothetical protein
MTKECALQPPSHQPPTSGGTHSGAKPLVRGP